MSVPIPLGVRIYQNWGHTIDVYVTDLVDDIQFRSVIPGGFANASLVLHNDRSTAWSQIAQQFNRVQICETRSREIVWEGRIDTVRRDSSADTWELGCLGAMAYASDIEKPHFFVDSDAASWLPASGATGEQFGVRPNTEAKSLTFAPPPATYAGPNHLPIVYTWEKARACNVYIGRFDATYSGAATTAALRTGMDVLDASAGTQTNVDLTAWNAATVRKSNVIVTDITALNANRLEVAWDYTGSPVVAAGNAGVVSSPVVQVQRVDETGAKLQTAASYPQEYLTVEQIVRDIVGRYMVGAWRTAANNSPYLGQVGSEQIFIDTSGTAQITHLTYYDGATAAQILTDLMEAQPGAYWALWETRYGATSSVNPDGRFRFEWALWPNSYGYEATSIDGLEEQPDGGGLANLIFWQHPNDVNADYIRLEEYFNTPEENQLLRDANLVRAITVTSDKATNTTDAFVKAEAYFRANQRTINTGTLTIKRPIAFFDDGTTSNSGGSRMVDPWAIRPGKLIRITDLPARGNGNTFNVGADSLADNFSRSASSGWGSTDTGRPWTNTGGAAADFSVSGGLGRHSMGTATNISRWTATPLYGADFDITATIATDVTPAGGSHFLYVAGRWMDANNNYLARIEFTTASAVALTIRKRVASTETSLGGGTVGGLTHAANTRFAVRFRAAGQSLMAKVWLASNAEPAAWTFSFTDGDLNEPGSIGFRSLLATANTNPLPVLATFDQLDARSAQNVFAPELDGTVFRVVGTTYSSADNSCVLELDQPPAWDTATQVLQSGSGSSNLVVRG